MKKSFIICNLMLLLTTKIYAQNLDAHYTICSEYDCKIEWSWDNYNLDTALGELCRAFDDQHDEPCWGYMGETSCDDKTLRATLNGFSEMYASYVMPIKATGCGKTWEGSIVFTAGKSKEFTFSAAWTDVACCETSCAFCEKYFSPLCPFEVLYNDNPEALEVFRDFRDEVLAKTDKGKTYVKLYYELSPLIIKILENNPDLKARYKTALEGLIPSIKRAVNKKSALRN